ncbi:DEAD/DEAH box helicase [Kiritimatiellota bacterium B12222]|nr:DEAD/DEAH box helicase [Kiritimatiellota bacterium B12222]
MPVSILKKVRAYLKKDAPTKPAPEKKETKAAGTSPKTETTASKPKAPARKEPARKKATIREETPSDLYGPEPLREAQRKRAVQPEEWRPGSGRKKASSNKGNTGGTESRNANRKGERSEKPPRAENSERSERKPRSGNGERSENGERSGNRTRSRSSSNRRPRNQNREGGGGNRSRNERNGDKPGSTRGKGFSFPRKKPDAGEWSATQVNIPEQEGKMRFAEVGLADEMLHAISDLGYQYCTPIQAEILPELLSGRDGMGQAQTGTGKTAAFLLASLTRLVKNPKPDLPNGSPRMLILAPTRELVLQIEEEAAELMKYTDMQSLPVYGGLDYEPQKEALRHHRVDLVAATPGRLIDFMRSRVIDLSHVEVLVLDEADRMLDMGFIPDVKRIVYATPHKDKRQTLFFSATFTDDIKRLATSWTRDPINIVIAPTSVAADTVDQTVYIVTDKEKFALTVNLLRDLKPARTLIFANRRDTSQDLCDHLQVYGFKAALLSGAVPQAKRVRTLEAFRDGSMPIVVATDVAGRGIHVDDVGLVINYNLPEDPEDYVHRIGRTGRAGEEGRSICFASEFDSMTLPDVEKYIGRELKCTHPEEKWLTVEERELPKRQRRSGGGGGGRGRQGGGGNRGRSGGGGGRSGGGNRGRR